MPLRDSFSAIDTFALVAEFRAMGKAWLEKAYDVPSGRVLLTFTAEGRKKRKLLIVPGKFATFVDKEIEHTDVPCGFVTSLRQLLGGLSMVGIVQPGGERYVEISFQRPMEETPRLLVLEFFGEGNMMVVKEGSIASVMHSKKWAHRTLRGGEKYVRPPSRRNPMKLTVSDVVEVLSRSKTDLVTTLAARVSLGGTISEEVVARIGRDPEEPAKKEPATVAREVVDAIVAMLSEVGDPPIGYLYREGDLLVDVAPFPSAFWRRKGASFEVLPTFSQAAYSFFSEATPVVQPPSPEGEERARLERLRAQQTSSIAQQELITRELREAADAILSNYAEVEEQVRKLLHEFPEERRTEIEVAGRKAKIDLRKSPRESAQELYDNAKRQLPKLEGARTALKGTEARLAALSKVLPTVKASLTEPRWPARKKHFWFEKAPRWFVTSTGRAVVGGRDAKSNDLVVKRYLKEQDIYIHADVHGAPSVVMKSFPRRSVDEETVREAGAWAVSYSKAWRAGHASADAFWVRGDQVSKAGGSGEYVPVGSWVIHGTKHAMKDLHIELGLGEVIHEGEHLIVAAPPSTFAAPGAKMFWRLHPGDEKDRAVVVKELSKDMGVSMELVQSLLPGGGIRLIRT